MKKFRRKECFSWAILEIAIIGIVCVKTTKLIEEYVAVQIPIV